jgi:TPR repeat protein
MNALGSMLLNGDEKETGEARDRVGAARLFARAGARGNAAADYNLAVCLETGAGAARDVDAAETLFRRACLNGLRKAHIALGYLAVRALDYGAAARHFQAVAFVADARDSSRLEEEGVTRADIAAATFCLADAHERAADVGAARLARVSRSGAFADALRLEATRADSWFFESDAFSENMSWEEKRLCAAYTETETAFRRAETRRAVLESTRSPEEDARRVIADDVMGKVFLARDLAGELMRRAAELGDGRAAFRVGVALWRRTASLGARPETMASRETSARWVARGARDGCAAAYRWLGDAALAGACRLDGVRDPGTARALYERAMRLGDEEGERRLAALEEKAWTDAKAAGSLRVYPTAPPKAWRRKVPSEWLDERIAG